MATGKNSKRFDVYDAPKETTRLLLDSARTAYETEEIGARTGETMKLQKEKLEATQDNLDDLKDISQAARRGIQAIEQKGVQKRMCLWSIIIFLLFANAFVIFLLIKNDGKLYSKYNR